MRHVILILSCLLAQDTFATSTADIVFCQALKDPFVRKLKNLMNPDIITGDREIDSKIIRLRKNPTSNTKYEFAKYIQKRIQKEFGIYSIAYPGGVYILNSDTLSSLKGKHWISRMATSIAETTETRKTSYTLALFIDDAINGGNRYVRNQKVIGIDWADLFAPSAGPGTIHEVRHGLTADEINKYRDGRIKYKHGNILPEMDIKPAPSLLNNGSQRIRNFYRQHCVDEIESYLSDASHALSMASRYSKVDPHIARQLLVYAIDAKNAANEFADIDLKVLTRAYNAISTNHSISVEVIADPRKYHDQKLVIPQKGNETSELYFHSDQVLNQNSKAVWEPMNNTELRDFLNNLMIIIFKAKKNIKELETTITRLNKEL